MRFQNGMSLSVGLLMGLGSVSADDLTPQDAMNEAKIGVSGRFVQIKAGTFEMGSPADESGRYTDETQHSVTLTKDFEMQATELTQLQYLLIIRRNPSGFRAESQCDAGNYGVVYGLEMCKNHPVESISWNDVQELIEKLNQMQNEYTYRLPTEAEWEYAARGGKSSSFPYSFGFNDTDELDNYAWLARTQITALTKSRPKRRISSDSTT